MPVQPPPVPSQEHRPVCSFPDGQVDRPGRTWRQRNSDHLAALIKKTVRVRRPRSRTRCSMSAPVASETRSPFNASSEISACSIGGPSPAATSSAPSSLRSSADGTGLVVHPGTADMSGRGVIQEFLLYRVLVEPGDSGQPAGDRGAARPPVFQVAREAFDVSAADGEQGQRAGAAPGSELAQVERVRLAGQAPVSGQEPGEGEPFRVSKGGLDRGERGGWGGSSYRAPPGRAGTGRLGQFRSQQLSGTPIKPPGPVTLCHKQASAGTSGPGEKCSPLPSMRGRLMASSP